MANSDVRKLEQRLERVTRERQCRVCALRTERCESCGSPQGMSTKAAEALHETMLANLDTISRRSASFAVRNFTDGLDDDEIIALREGYATLLAAGPSHEAVEALRQQIIERRS